MNRRGLSGLTAGELMLLAELMAPSPPSGTFFAYSERDEREREMRRQERREALDRMEREHERKAAERQKQLDATAEIKIPAAEAKRQRKNAKRLENLRG